MNSLHSRRIAPDASRFRWLSGLLVSVAAFAVLAFGLSLRPAHISNVTVNLGGIFVDAGSGRIQFSPFDGINDVEYFLQNEVFAKVGGLNGKCAASTHYAPDGGRVQLSCKADSEAQVRQMTQSAVEPLFQRHARKFEIASAAEAHRKALNNRELTAARKTLELLQKSSASTWAQVEIVGQQLKIEDLQQKEVLERMLENRVIPSRMDPSGITVVNRKPGARVWAAVVVLSLLVGLFVAASPWILKRFGHEPRSDA